MNFENLIEQIEKKVVSAIADPSFETAPTSGNLIVEDAINSVVGSPSTQEQLLLLATVPHLAGVEVRNLDLGEIETAGTFVEALLRSVLHNRLALLKRRVAREGFVIGFLPAVDTLISLAESAEPSPWISQQAVEETRDAFRRMADGEGSEDDFHCLFQSTGLLGGLLMAPTDIYSQNKAGINLDSAREATVQVKLMINTLLEQFPFEVHDDILPDLLQRMANRYSNAPLDLTQIHRQ